MKDSSLTMALVAMSRMQLASVGYMPYYMKPTFGNVPVKPLPDICKIKPKQQHRFVIKGVEIMASSRKDAIKKYNHLKKNNYV